MDPDDVSLRTLSGVRTVKCARLNALGEAALAEHDLILPFDPPRFGADPTLGGVMATNIGGAERESMGAPRDNLLGAQYINGKGELLKAGGRSLLPGPPAPAAGFFGRCAGPFCRCAGRSIRILIRIRS